MSATPGVAEPRVYELRLARISDARLRHQVARWLAQRFPTHEFQVVVTALGGSGFVTRVGLRDDEAPALLRELYAAGAPPAAVFLLPVATESREADQDVRSQRAFAVFAEGGGRFVPTWSWTAFIFGPFWYFRKGLYAKGLVLLVLGVFPFWPLPVALLVSLLVLVYCGLVGNWDDYLWRVKRTQWW